MTEYADSTELTAARVRHLAHRGQLPETARMLAVDAFRDTKDAFLRGDRCMEYAKILQYLYWLRRTRKTASPLYEEVAQHLERSGTIRRDPRWTA